MFGLPATVFAVWGYVLAKQRPDRAKKVFTVELNPAVLSATFAAPESEIVKAISVLCSEDPRSRSPEEGGRRLVPFGDSVGAGPMLYRVVNGAKYAAMRDEDERRLYLREAKRSERERRKASTESTTVNNVNRGQPPSTQLESESEAELDPSTLRVSGSRTHARESEPKGIADLGRHVRLAFAARYASARAGASLPQTPANAKSLAAITEWCRDTANARGADAFGLATRLVDAFFASQKASGAGYRVAWLAQDPLEYLEPSQSRAAEPKGAASHVSTTFDESNNPEWAR